VRSSASVNGHGGNCDRDRRTMPSASVVHQAVPRMRTSASAASTGSASRGPVRHGRYAARTTSDAFAVHAAIARARAARRPSV
jgi:hypothetical protein